MGTEITMAPDGWIPGQLEIPDAERPALGPGARCQWDPLHVIPAISPDTGRKTRADAKFCGKRCRQSSWRFGQPDRPARELLDTTARTFAYADPPYPGMSARFYSGHRDYAGEVDHAELIGRLIQEFPDGWALSTSSKTLRGVLELCPAGVTIGAWTKPMPPIDSHGPVCAWEPVIFHGGRPLIKDAPMVLDWVHAAPPRVYPGQATGIKPARFSWWLFDCLGAAAGDVLVDLYPGSGAVSRAWQRFQGRGDGC